MTNITNEDETMPKERVYVVQMKPWEAMLLIPGEEEGEPIKATFDRRKDEFTIHMDSDKVQIEGGGEWNDPAREMRCPGCAGANFVWRPDGDFVWLECAQCDYVVIKGQMDALMSTLSADALYEMSPDTWEWA